MTNASRNPIVAHLPHPALPNWRIRRYADGTHDAYTTNSVAITGGYGSFAKAAAAAEELARIDVADRQAALEHEAATMGTHVARARALYLYDPFVTNEQYGRFMEEAYEEDAADADRAELPDDEGGPRA